MRRQFDEASFLSVARKRQPSADVRFYGLKMMRQAILFASVLAAAHLSTVRDSNRFLDVLLEDKVPMNLREYRTIYPTANVPEFKFKIPSTGVTNREVSVKVKPGTIRGFDTGVRRTGECHPPVLIEGNVTIACLIDFGGINASFKTEVKGDTIVRKEKTVYVNVTVVDTVARFEATAMPGRPGSLRTFYIEHINLHTVPDKKLNLNTERQRKFSQEIEEVLQSTIYNLLYTEYKTALERAIEKTPFPRA